MITSFCHQFYIYFNTIKNVKFHRIDMYTTDMNFKKEIINVISFRDCVSYFDMRVLRCLDDVITWLDQFGNQTFLSPGNQQMLLEMI